MAVAETCLLLLLSFADVLGDPAEQFREQAFDAALDLMEVDLFVKRVSGEQELLSCGRAFASRQNVGTSIGAKPSSWSVSGRVDLDGPHPDVLHQPIEIDGAGLGAGHQLIPAEIIQTIGVEAR